MARAIGPATMKWFGYQATCRVTDIIGSTVNTCARNAATTGIDDMIIVNTTRTTATADNLAESKANYEKDYYRVRAVFYACGRNAGFVRIG